MEASLIDASDPAWREALTRVTHDVYHLPKYVELAARHHHPGQPVAFIASAGRDRFLLPLILRPIPGTSDADLRDAISPRGYPGPAATPGIDPGFLCSAIDALPDVLRRARVVTAFIRLDPLSRVPLPVLRRVGEVVEHAPSVSIDLELSQDALQRQTRSNHRRDIARARRAGYVARIDHDWSRFRDFHRAYLESMARLDSDPFWRLSDTYFLDLRAALGKHLHLGVVELDGATAAGALLTEIDGRVEYHLAGTMDAHVRMSPSKLLVDAARGWAKERGNRRLHLGGSPNRDDPLTHWKLGFSPHTHAVASWRVVSDEGAVARLDRAWTAMHGVAPDPRDPRFPSYRRPAPALP